MPCIAASLSVLAVPLDQGARTLCLAMAATLHGLGIFRAARARWVSSLRPKVSGRGRAVALRDHAAHGKRQNRVFPRNCQALLPTAVNAAASASTTRGIRA